ncbi:DODA-type extradiol aromatic ring-opening family dioxygenase [Effusibacillus consociatus]|uniref:DODA-type extradiol aromatic ring-opening family dioxygenase n=1 Tax=Effusibacillus consociatus TaxID=1117041 RepID=A0ABV9Q8P5_9BACL
MALSYFICHGSPTLAVEDNEYTRFLRNLGEQTQKPKAIVIFTAHWENQVLSITDSDDIYETIYDFGGFPEELYSVKYPAKGSRKTASMLQEMFQRQGIPVRKDAKRGLDHGSWVVLRHMYPEEEVPVVQVSVNPYLSPEEQYKIGESIRDLGKEDILVIGSGATVHNLGTLAWGKETAEPWALEFDDWLIDKVQKRDLDSLFAYETLAPYARRAVPRAEHFVPLFITLGSGNPELSPKLLHRSYNYGTLSHIGFQF